MDDLNVYDVFTVIGAVMAFNSIYRDFREDTGMTSEFTLNLLFSFLTSLKLSRKLPNESLLITSTKQAIKHLERILIKKKDRFNTASLKQRNTKKKYVRLHCGMRTCLY